MKKIILSLVVFLGILFSGISGVFAEDNYKGQPVFKIFSYSYNKQNQTYVLQSYGSAVYLGNKTILTNNHVISNIKGDYDGFYEVCETRDFTKRPVCFTSAEILYTDKSKDLALLKLEEEPKNNKKVEFSTEKLTIGDKVETYGYPSNGGVTITFTSGKISGFDSGKYKIDANIDSGSSGGGAFDNDKNLVGLTTSVVSGYTTLGYLVPISDLKNFIIKKGNITEPIQKNLDDFNNFLKKYQKRLNSDEIKTDFIELKNISKYGFAIYENIFDKKEEINKYFLESKSGNTLVEISYDLENGINTEFTEKDYKNINKLFNIKNNIAQDIFYKNRKYFYKFTLDKTTKYLEIVFERNNVVYKIKGNLDEKSEIKNALILFFKNSKIKKIEKVSETIFIDGLRIDKKSDFLITKYLNQNNEISFVGIKKINSTLLSVSGVIYKFQKPEDYLTNGFGNFIEKYKKRFSGKGIYSDFFTDSKGNVFSYVKSNNGKNISYNFEVIKNNDDMIYSYNFIVIVYGKDDIDKELKTFFYNVDFEGKNIFKDEEIKKAKIKKLDEIDFTNIIFNRKEVNPNFKEDYTKSYTLKVLNDISGKDLIFTNFINNNSNQYLLLQVERNLLKTKSGKKYIKKFSVFIPKLSTKKLKKVTGKLEKIDLNNAKFKKYKLVLEYIKYGILVELEKRK